MDKELKIDFDLLIRAVAREVMDPPAKPFYNDEKSSQDVDLAVEKYMRGAFISIYQDKIPDFQNLLQD